MVIGCGGSTKTKPQRYSHLFDVRKPNVSIQRTRHITPTLDELISNMNNSNVFSEDRHEEWLSSTSFESKIRYITAFSTHMGPYQFKKIAFGISSAVFQHIISSLITTYLVP